jgi:hypothetical protein
MLWHSNLYANWHNHFTHMDEYFEYLLGDLSYMREIMFIMQWIGQHELSLDTHPGTMKAYNQMHAEYKLSHNGTLGGSRASGEGS